MTDRDRLAADLLAGIEQAWQDDLLYGGNAEALDPSGWTRSTFPEAANRLADRLIALGWTRLDEERLARALPFGAIGADEYNEPDDYYRECAAAIAKAYREDTDAATD